MKSIICISGKAQNGKDTVANMMKINLQSCGYKVLVAHYADLLKYICKTFFNWDGNKDETGRSILQRVGTEVIRNKKPDFWVSFIIDILNFFEDEWDYVLIPDSRFPNEVMQLIKAGFNVNFIRVKRTGFISPLTEEQQKHESETALDNYKPDYLLLNDDTLSTLKSKVDELTEKIIKLSFKEV